MTLVVWIREKRFIRIASFVLLGLVCFAFYPVRNYYISGWLFYPFEAIDLFTVEWKIPLEHSLIDSAQIKVWGRCLYDIAKVDWPVRDWLPVWWEAQQHYSQMLIYSQFVGAALIAVNYGSHLDNYLMDNLVFGKHNLSDPYYLVPKPFDRPEMQVDYTGPDGSIAIYYPAGWNEDNSYYTPLSTCYYPMWERTELIGDTVEEGFRPKW